MQKLRLWDILDLHSFQLSLADSATRLTSEQLVS